jgi:hypothetical protein
MQATHNRVSRIRTTSTHTQKINVLGEPMNNAVPLRQTRTALEHEVNTFGRRGACHYPKSFSDPEVFHHMFNRNTCAMGDISAEQS